jgi:hypothetical protein
MKKDWADKQAYRYFPHAPSLCDELAKAFRDCKFKGYKEGIKDYKETEQKLAYARGHEAGYVAGTQDTLDRRWNER